MKKIAIAAALAAGLSLAACGGKGDDAMADNAAAGLEAQADNLEAQGLEAQADNLEDEADRKEEAIDDSDINATALNGAQQAEVANKM